MGRSLSFGSIACDLVALLRLAFATAPSLRDLAWPQTITRRFIMQKARRHPLPTRGSAIGLRQLVGTWFQVLLTPLIGVLFIVQSPYLSAIGRDVVLSLGGWAPQLHTEFHELRATLVRQPQRRARDAAYGTVTLYRETFQTLRLSLPL